MAAYLAITKHAESKQLQDDLETLQAWEIDWDMEVNPGKCQVIRVMIKITPPNFLYTLYGQTLEVVSSAKYQGIDIASDLSWKPRITRITNTANLKAKNPEHTERAYKAIVHPQLKYGPTHS